ncbi:hypothetical protein [Mechercharimyces sp. CAU 1602]|uniref:hypothetical protein n=1 Tax=Mechercharimyces sp. CAU 1602 TaxID=2973933 RepID=UPI0021628A71|nr:hypothetical protein [Mechercharimyces sp. CAU 1602]MCS1350179.1 hypothetical protein [Mechercharimyces sp. CAU 1602]
MIDKKSSDDGPINGRGKFKKLKSLDTSQAWTPEKVQKELEEVIKRKRKNTKHGLV